MKRLVAALAAAALLTLAACADDTGTGTPPPSTAAPSRTSAPPLPPPSVAASQRSGGWVTGPLTVRHDVAVPPVPVVVRIRHAQHPADGYDRIVFDVSGALPGYDVRYVARPIGDATGEPVSMPGRRFLQIRLMPADAHDQSGASAVPRSRTLGYPMLEAYAVTGDFEAVVTIVLGLDDVVAFRVGELPSRIYVDVAA
ncbi:hypothetical protein AB0J82_23020 [Asanoa sp. NPDC049518]|uniref:AMIN-like domain-containing (lipo)protein n=1 Tax=unclassified Asanoa TaxID=2685164 RepID=UPI0034235771